METEMDTQISDIATYSENDFDNTIEGCMPNSATDIGLTIYTNEDNYANKNTKHGRYHSRPTRQNIQMHIHKKTILNHF